MYVYLFISRNYFVLSVFKLTRIHVHSLTISERYLFVSYLLISCDYLPSIKAILNFGY